MGQFLRQLICVVFVCLFSTSAKAQSVVDVIQDTVKASEFSPTFSKKRFYTAAGFATATYAAFSVGLYNSWYKDYPMGKFRLFNDWGEWQQMDKAGHVFSGYFQTRLTYRGAKWAGMTERSSIATGILMGTLFQTTLEVMDGVSEQWGFSIGDIASNTAGIGCFALQQKYWGEQRISIKESAYPVKYNQSILIEPTSGSGNKLTQKQRADVLYGSSLAERLLKDYNAQTYWASVNVHSFLNEGTKWPRWLNIALGYSASGMFGGFNNQALIDNNRYDFNNQLRTRQFLIALDIDFNKIRTRNYFFNSLLEVAQLLKVPSPAIEITHRGEVMFHFVYF